MKNLLTLLFIGLCSNFIFASHIAGGEITYECLGGNQYRIKYVFFRDCSGSSLPSSTNIDIYDVNGNQVQSPSIPLVNQTTINGVAPNPCTIVPTVCLVIGEYEGIVTLPPLGGGYQLVTDNCCRNGGIVNGPAGNAAYTTFIPDPTIASCNNSAVYNGWPPVFICQGTAFTFDHSASDADGDSLVYSLCTPYENIIPSAPYPFNSPFSATNPLGGNTLAIDPVTGELTGTPSMIGRFVVGICVSEYRNGVLINTSTRDFQLNVVVCQEVTVSSAINALTNCNTREVTFFNNSTGATSFFWDFGDGSTSTDSDPVHNYPSYQTYNVTLIAYNAGSPQCNDTVSTIVALVDTCSPCGMVATVSTTDGICNAIDGCVEVVWTHPCSSNAGIVYGGISISGGCGGGSNISAGAAPNYSSIVATVDGHTLPDVHGTETITLLGPASPCNGQVVTSSSGGNIVFTFTAVYTQPQTGSATVGITGGTAPYSVQWTTTPTQTGTTASGVDPGTYNVIVTDANGCVEVVPFVVAGTSNMTLNATGTDISACGADDGTLNVTVGGSTGTVTYLWSPGGYTTQSVSNVPPGFYTVEVSDDDCSTTDTITIHDLATIDVTININDITCPTETNGSASVTSTVGGVGPYTYVWSSSPLQTGTNATNLPFGFYTLVATDQNGCEGNISFGITGPTAMNSTITPTIPSCAGLNDGSVTTVVTGGAAPINISWNSSPPQSGTTASNIPGNQQYNVTIVDGNGCSITDSVFLTIPPSLNLDLYDLSTITCAGVFTGSAFADVSGGQPDMYNTSVLYTEPFNTDDLEIDCGSWYVDVTGAGTSNILDPLDYFRVINNQFAGQDLDGEGVWYSQIIDISAQANVTISGDFFECGNMEAADYVRAYYKINGGPEILWFDLTNDGGVDCALNSPSLGALSGNTIQIVVRMLNNSGEIHRFDNININGNVSGVLYNEPFNTNDLWNDPNCAWWRDVTGVATTDISGAGAVDHIRVEGGQMEFQDLDGEVIWYSATVDISSCVSASISADFDYSGTLNASEYIRGLYSLDGGGEVLWVDHTDDNAAGWPTGNPSSDMVTGLVGNTLQFIVRVNNSGSSDIHMLDNVVIGCTTINPNPYIYAWTCTGATTDTVINLPVGLCTFTVTDSAGCTASDTLTIANPGVLSAATTLTSACGGLNGSITGVGTGGNLPYTYSWDCSASTNQTISGLAAGASCNVTITDAVGCTAVANGIIPNDLPPVLDTVSVSTSCLDDGTIDISVTGGTPGFTYYWSHGDSIQDVSNLPGPITYTVSVWDANNCFDTMSIFVDTMCVPPCSAVYSYPLPSYCQNDIDPTPTITGDLGGIFTSTPAGLNINGTTGEIDLSASTPGTYGVLYTVSVGTCNDTLTVYVTVSPNYNLTENINVCENVLHTYPDGATSTITGNESHTSNLTTTAGCDSIIVTNVTMDPIFNITDNINVCENVLHTYPDGATSTITGNESHTSNLTSTAGCDSIIVTNVTMDPIFNITDNINVCENVLHTYPDGATSTITGNESHTSNLTTTAGCDSIIVTNVTMDPIFNITDNINVCENILHTYPDGATSTITGNESHTSNLTTTAGCDSIIVTNVTMDPIYNITDNINVCENILHTYPDGTTSTITGNESHTSNLTTTAGCDSIIVTNVTMDPIFNITDNINVCENVLHTYPDGATSTITGNESHTSNLTSTAGCDSIIVTNVTVDPIFNITDNINVCENVLHTYPDGATSTITGNESHTSNLTTTAGCDSIIVTNVTMDPIINITDNINVCENVLHTYPDGTTSTITGNESHTSNLTSTAGCDSIIVTNVTMDPIYNITDNINVCENVLHTYPDGATSTITGNESHTSNLTTTAGCDSIIVTNVTMDPIFNITDNINVCENVLHTYPDGATSTITGNESHTSNLTSTAGCDSIIVTNVTMDPIFNITDNINVCENVLHTYPDGATSTITGNESHTSNLTTTAGCDSIIVTNVTMDPIFNITDNINVCENVLHTYPDGATSTITGNESHTSNLTSTAGCDSIIVTNVTMDPIFNITDNINVCENVLHTYPDGATSIITGNESHTSNLTSTAGCDSIIVTNVTMDPIFNITDNINVCENVLHTYPDGATSTITGNESHTSILTTTAGCDSTITTNVTMIPSILNAINIGICTGSNYTYADGTVSTNITVNENHISTLSAGNGCDSILTENISIVLSVSNTLDTNICSGTSYTYADGSASTNITVNESLITTLLTLGGCDSVLTENVIVIVPIFNTLNNTICNASNFTYADGTTSTNITVNENHVSTLTSIAGCDSTVTENLTVLAPITNSLNYDICEGGSFTYTDGTNVTNVTVNENHVSILTSTAGCDSVVTENLNVNPIYNITDNINVCENVLHTYPDGVTSTIIGNESHTSNLTTTAGCDSIIVTNVTMDPIFNITDNINVCENVLHTYPDGATSTITGNESHTSNLTSTAGCDSTIVTNVTMLPAQTATLNITICNGDDYTYADGVISTNITVNETHTSTLFSVNGCDSTVIENIISPAAIVSSQTLSICSGLSVTVGTNSYNATGVYTDILTSSNGCDSTVTTNLTVDPLEDAGFNYSGASICISSPNPSPTITGNTGGVFTIDNGGTINSATGEINLTTTGAGTYTITYTTSGPCPVFTDLVVTITSLDDASFSYPNASYCIDASNPSPTITGVTGGTFTIDNSGSINATTGEIDLNLSGAGAYTITYTTTGACANSSTQAVTITPLDNAGFTYTAANYCITDLNPSASITGGVNGVFSINNGGVINSTTGEIDLTASGAGTYTVDFITTGACPNSSSVSITIDPLDDASFSYAATQYCNNDPFPLPTIAGVTGGVFTIDNGGVINPSTGEVDVNASGLGTFIINYNTNTACAGSAIFTITIINCSPPIADFSISDSVICAGECIDLVDLSQLGTSLLWVMTGGTPDSSTSPNPTVCYNNSGTYTITLTVTNQFGSDSQSISVTVISTPPVDAGADVTIPLGATVPLTATGANSYLWSPSYYLSCSNCPDPIVAITETTTFVVIAVDDNGCTASDTVTVIIDGEIEIYIPNIFSPNNDGENDLFKVYGSSFPERYSMQIYNRWGGLIFESNDENVNWDGTKDGEILPQAVFVYKFQGTTIVGQFIEKKGNVMLAR